MVLGCHQGAMYSFYINTLAARISFLRIRSFLLECGTRLPQDACPTVGDLMFDESSVMQEMDTFCAQGASVVTQRATHTPICIKRRVRGAYLNEWHRRLSNGSLEDMLLCYFDV